MRSGTWDRCRWRGASRSAGSPGAGGSVTGRGCSSWCRRGGCTGSSRWRSGRCCWRWTSPGRVEEILPQPFRLRFETAGGEFREHVPDFLAVFRDGSRWLFDVRPATLVKEEDATCFAAAAEAALEAGWRYSVVAGWRPHVLTGLDALSAQRRDLEDRLGLQDCLLRARVRGAGRVRGPGRGDAAAGGRPRARAAPALASSAGDRPVPPARRRVAGLAGRRRAADGGQAGLLELSAGSALRLDGTEWTVAVDRGPARPGAAPRGRGGGLAEHPVAGASSGLPVRPGRGRGAGEAGRAAAGPG